MGIATDSLRTYFFRIATLGANFLIGVLTARYLGPAGKGLFALALLYASLYTMIFGSLSGASVYQLTRLQTTPQSVLGTSASYSLALGLLTTIAVGFYTIRALGPGEQYLWMLALGAPLLLLINSFTGFFLGLNRIATVNWFSLISGSTLLVLLGIGYLGFKIGIILTLGCWVFANLATVSWAFWQSREYLWPFSLTNFKPQLLLRMLGFGWQISLVNLITFLNYRVDMFLVAHFLGQEKLGVYSVAVSVAELLWFTSSAIAMAIYAKVGLAQTEAAGRLTAKAARHTLNINLILGVLLWVSAELFLAPIYGEIYRPAMIPLRILLPGVLAYGLAGIFSTYFTNQLGKPRVALFISLLAMSLNVLISLLLIPRIGMVGGAWATTISYLLAIMVLILVFHKGTGLKWREICCLDRTDWQDYRSLAGKIREYLSKKLKSF